MPGTGDGGREVGGDRGGGIPPSAPPPVSPVPCPCRVVLGTVPHHLQHFCLPSGCLAALVNIHDPHYPLSLGSPTLRLKITPQGGRGVGGEICVPCPPPSPHTHPGVGFFASLLPCPRGWGRSRRGRCQCWRCSIVPHLGGHPHSAAGGWLLVLPRVPATLVRPSWCPRGTGRAAGC